MKQTTTTKNKIIKTVIHNQEKKNVYESTKDCRKTYKDCGDGFGNYWCEIHKRLESPGVWI